MCLGIGTGVSESRRVPALILKTRTLTPPFNHLSTNNPTSKSKSCKNCRLQAFSPPKILSKHTFTKCLQCLLPKRAPLLLPYSLSLRTPGSTPYLLWMLLISSVSLPVPLPAITASCARLPKKASFYFFFTPPS